MTGQATFIFESSSRLSAKTDSHALILMARHQFEFYSKVKPPCTVFKSVIPHNVNVVSSGRLELVLSGHLNGSKISPETYVKSHLAQYIVGFLRNNSTQLGIEHVSSVLIEDNDQAKVILMLNQSREPQHPQVPLRVILRKIHLDLAWSSISRSQVVSCTIQNHLFSEQMSLPIQGLVENVIGRFVTWHLVRRYPLIFGALNKALPELDITSMLLIMILSTATPHRDTVFQKNLSCNFGNGRTFHEHLFCTPVQEYRRGTK
ncbi:hypothetical protein L218DRAFT_965296 [Marasmius fiardii PR-910]|nr:hypothetical protein L218DRAFT_965296 [Marasmius fiardii PR-910]